MSLLPQRKKSAEEIAKLRESLGVPGISPEEDPAPPHEDPPATEAPADVVELTPDVINSVTDSVHLTDEPEPVTPLPVEPEPAPRGPKPVHSLKRSERVPFPLSKQPAAPKRQPKGPRAVHSLRKSEQVALPATPHEPDPDSVLPIHRHSDKELDEIRRRDALAAMTAGPNPKLITAPLYMIIAGYLLAIAGASCFFFYEFPMAATAACSAAALVIAGYVFVKHPLTRHHAGFIAVIALFVIIFGSLHYFPYLRHAT